MKTSGNVKDSSLSVARLAISAVPEPPGHFPQPESAGFAVSPSPLITTVQGSLQIQATIKSPLRYLGELTFLWFNESLGETKGLVSFVCILLAPSRRRSRTLHLPCCSLSVCPDLLHPDFMSTFVSRQKWMFTVRSLDNRTWI